MKRYVIMVCMMFLSFTSPAQTPKHEARPPAVSPPDQQEMQALTNDVSRMRTLLRQMEMNLAFVQNTQTPLKHQFELEIDMWRMVLDGMERRLQRLRGSSGGVASPDTVLLRQDLRQGKP